MIIRRATESDAASIIRLFVETVQTVNAKDYSGQQIRAWIAGATDRERWLNRIHTQHFLVAEEAQKLCGFASISDTGYLDLMYVSKDWHGKGVGKNLLVAIEKIASNLDMQRIESDVSITARPFFEKHGYKTLREQQVIVRNVAIVNYKMVKEMKAGS